MRYLFLFFFFLFAMLAFGQDKIVIDVKVADKKTGKKESGVTMTIFDGTKKVASGVSTNKGDITLYAPIGPTYKVVFTKPGKVSRFFNVETKGIDMELIQGSEMPVVFCEVTLFDNVSGVDFSYVKDTPFTLFKFDGKSANLAYDSKMASQMAKTIDQLLIQAENQEKNNEVQYQAKMKQGESYFAQKKYQEAMVSFEQALLFKENDKTAIKRISDMEKLLMSNQVDIVQGTALDGEYDKLVKEAADLKAAKKYKEAISKLDEALEVKKGDLFCLDEIDRLEKLWKEEQAVKEKEEKYKKAMALGDQMLGQKSYETALKNYEEALLAKPNDPTALSKKAQVEKLLNADKEAKEKKAQYEKLVAEADGLFTQENWAEAKAKYQEAQKIESASTYVQERIKKIDEKLDALQKEKEKEEKIKNLLTEGNSLFTASKWTEAKAKYQEVIQLDKENAEATSQISLIDKKLAEEKDNLEKEKQFAAFVKDGDVAMTAKKYEEAISKYQAALEIKSDIEVQKKIDAATLEIEKIANAHKTKEMYDAAIKAGLELLSQNDLENARIKFVEASTLDDTQKLPKEKIAEIDTKIADAKSKQQLEEQFNELMSQAKDLFDNGDLQGAKTKYEQAKLIDKTATTPDEKIAEINAILEKQAKEEQQQTEIATLIQQGDELFSTQKYAEAIAVYKKVLEKDNDNQQAKSQIELAEKALLDEQNQKEKEAAIAQRKESYEQAMAKGDNLKGDLKFDEAIAAYEEAKQFTDDFTPIEEKIKEVNDLKANADKAKAAKELHDKYIAAFQKAEDLQKEKKYQEAIAAYNEAKAIDATQTEPDLKIKEINQILEDLAQQEQQDAAEKQKEEEKEKLIASIFEAGDLLVSEEKYSDAIAKYSEIQTIDPQNAEVEAKITKATDLLKQQQAQQSQQETSEKYAEAFQKGMLAYADQKFDEAITAFNLAKTIDPSKTEPQQKIDEIIVLKQRLDEQQAAAEISEKYNAYIQDADAMLEAKNYAEAIKAYQSASKIMPDEEYPKKQIKEIEDLVEAETILRQKEKQEEQYNEWLAKGNEAFAAQEYENALTAYKDAQQIKNSEEVQNKIAEAQAKFDALTKENEADRIQKQYDDFMQKARALEASKELQEAIDNYKLASRLKEDEQEPKDKIASLTEELKEQELLAEVDNRYKKAMTNGLSAYEKEEYNEAIKFFNEALEIKNDEQEPKDMISKSEEKLKAISSKDEDIQFEKMLQFAQQKIDEKDYQKAMELLVRAESNRPDDKQLLEMKKKVQDILENEKAYKEQIEIADKLAEEQAYEQAILAYQKAADLKPEESYPASRITAMQNNLSSSNKKGEMQKKYESLLAEAQELAAENKLEQALTIASEAVTVIPLDKRALELVNHIKDLIAANNKKQNEASFETQYASLLSTADDLFNNKKWSEAKIAYEKAQVIKPSEPYLSGQIQQCVSNLAEADSKRAKYLTILATADADFKNNNLEKAKSGYALALTYDQQEYPQEQIRTIDKLLAQKSKNEGGKLDPLGEEIDNSLMEGAALLARAEEYRRTAKGELVKVEKNKAIAHTDSIQTNRKDLIAANMDTLKHTKEIVVEDWLEYYDDQFEKDKQIKEIDYAQTDLMLQWSGFNYSDNVENKRRMNIHQEIKLGRENQFIDYNNEWSDSVIFIRKDIENRYDVYSNSDYDFIMADKNKMHETKELIAKQKVDEEGKHDEVVDLVKAENENAVQENFKQSKIHADKIDNVVNTLDLTEEKDRERTNFFEKDHTDLSDAVKDARDFAVEEENKSFNNTYTKQLKARVEVKKEEERTVAANKAYLDNKSLDIDKSRERLNQTSFKYDTDNKNDDDQREEARLFMRETEKKTVTQNFEAAQKEEMKMDKVKGVSEKETTLQNVANTEKKENLYDTRSELKTLEVSKVKYPAKVANQIGKDYPEGVSQETFQQKGPDGLPNAIITRRVVVINGYGNVYTRTQKYGSITYSKNGEICTEQIWRNETTDSKLDKHY